MKKIIKILSCLSLCLCFIAPLKINAEETAIQDEPIILVDENTGIGIETTYSSLDYYVVREEVGNTVVFDIISNSTNEAIDTFEISIDNSKLRAGNYSEYRIYNSKAFCSGTITKGVLNVELCFNVYSSGSFREITEYFGYTEYIEGWSLYRLDKFNVYKQRPANSTNSFPCTDFEFSYSATVNVELSASASLNYGQTLVNNNFDIGGSVGTNIKYTKLVPHSFVVHLYQ